MVPLNSCCWHWSQVTQHYLGLKNTGILGLIAAIIRSRRYDVIFNIIRAGTLGGIIYWPPNTHWVSKQALVICLSKYPIHSIWAKLTLLFTYYRGFKLRWHLPLVRVLKRYLCGSKVARHPSQNSPTAIDVYSTPKPWPTTTDHTIISPPPTHIQQRIVTSTVICEPH